MSTPIPPITRHAAPTQAPYGGGVRLNKVALYLLGTAVAIFLFIMAMVANDRANPKQREADTPRRHGNTSLFASELAGDRPDGIIAASSPAVAKEPDFRPENPNLPPMPPSVPP